MTLGELIERLERAIKKDGVDPAKVCRPGFGPAHSYRGDYAQVAFRPVPEATVGGMRTHAKSALGKEFSGWKAGEYTMHEHVDAYLADPGGLGELLTEATIAHMLGQCEPHATALSLAREAGYRDGLAACVDFKLAAEKANAEVDALLASQRQGDAQQMTQHERREAWDRYAAAALASPMADEAAKAPSVNTAEHDAANCAARIADAILTERDRRVTYPEREGRVASVPALPIDPAADDVVDRLVRDAQARTRESIARRVHKEALDMDTEEKTGALLDLEAKIRGEA